MATGAQVMRMLCPEGGYVIYGDDFDSILWDENAKKITKAQFAKGFAEFDAYDADKQTTKANEKAALLAKLGINQDEAKLLLS
jgi:hypothetical protein